MTQEKINWLDNQTKAKTVTFSEILEQYNTVSANKAKLNNSMYELGRMVMMTGLSSRKIAEKIKWNLKKE